MYMDRKGSFFDKVIRSKLFIACFKKHMTLFFRNYWGICINMKIYGNKWQFKSYCKFYTKFFLHSTSFLMLKLQGKRLEETPSGYSWISLVDLLRLLSCMKVWRRGGVRARDREVRSQIHSTCSIESKYFCKLHLMVEAKRRDCPATPPSLPPLPVAMGLCSILAHSKFSHFPFSISNFPFAKAENTWCSFPPLLLVHCQAICLINLTSSSSSIKGK